MEYKRKLIYLTGFFIAMAMALTSFINSSYLENYTNKNYVGMFFALGSILAIWGLSKMPKILNRYGNRKTMLYLCLISFGSLLTMALSQNAIAVILAFIIMFASQSFIITSLDIFLEDFSRNSSVGSIRGLYLTFVNLAWVIAELASAIILGDSKNFFWVIYLLASLFILLASWIIYFHIKNFKDPEYIKTTTVKNLKFFLKNKNIFKVYILNLSLRFFFAWMVIYTPIYLHEYIGLPWGKIGIIFAIMLLPFVILDYPLGKLSDKFGEKEMLIAGFIISAIATFCIPFLSKPEIYVWGSILFITRIGAATIEDMTEIYFFKSVPKENEGALSFFRNANSIAYLLAPILALLIFLLTPSFEYIFFVLGVIMLCGALISIRLKDIK